MQFEERTIINAAPEKIFPFYENVSEWSSWDPDVLSSSIDGNFVRGAKGKLKPAKGPEASIEFIEVIKNKSFTTISKLPLCTMSFEHKLIPSNGMTEVVHKVSFKGLLSPIFGRLIGSEIKKRLPDTLKGLKNIVESKGS